MTKFYKIKEGDEKFTDDLRKCVLKKTEDNFCWFLDSCASDAACQSGGDSNKICDSGSCVCKSGYLSGAAGLCEQGKNDNFLL